MDCNCGVNKASYRVVQTIRERNTIPCEERSLGMLVVVVQDSYNTYMLQGQDACANINWVLYNLTDKVLVEKLGSVWIVDIGEDVSDEYLNTLYPKAIDGFRVNVKSLNTTFTKVKDTWILTNYSI